MEYNTKIYLHKRLDTGEVFYVGIGGGDRPWETSSRNKFWRNIVKKAGYEVVVIEDCLTWDQACEIETMLVAHYGRRDRRKGPLVNLTNGGDGCPGHKHSPETRAKMSMAKQNISPETRAKLSAAQKGNTHSPETLAKMSASLKGRTHSEETRAKLSDAQKGNTHSPEARAKMSAAKKGKTPPNKGKTHSPETRAKISAAHKGKPRSPETRAKLSAARKAYLEAKRKGH